MAAPTSGSEGPASVRYTTLWGSTCSRGNGAGNGYPDAVRCPCDRRSQPRADTGRAGLRIRAHRLDQHAVLCLQHRTSHRSRAGG